MNNRIVKINPAHIYKTTDHEDALATMAERYGCDVFWKYNESEQLGHIRNINVMHGIFKNGCEAILTCYGNIIQFMPSLRKVDDSTPVYYKLVSDYETIHTFQRITAIQVDRLEKAIINVLKEADEVDQSLALDNIQTASSDLENLFCDTTGEL